MPHIQRSFCVHAYRCIKQGGQYVLLRVAHLGTILFESIHHEADVLAGDLVQALADCSTG